MNAFVARCEAYCLWAARASAARAKLLHRNMWSPCFIFFFFKKSIFENCGCSAVDQGDPGMSSSTKAGGATRISKVKTTLVSLAQKFGRIEPNEKGEHL